MDTTQTQILIEILIESYKINAKIDAFALIKLDQEQSEYFKELVDKAFQSHRSKFALKYRDLLSENDGEILQSLFD